MSEIDLTPFGQTDMSPNVCVRACPIMSFDVRFAISDAAVRLNQQVSTGDTFNFSTSLFALFEVSFMYFFRHYEVQCKAERLTNPSNA